MEKLFVDFHVIQTVPPSCVNRDDTGSPKTAFYGGVQRARVSSQSWKHAVREMFKDYFQEEDLGLRTKKIVDLVAAQIQKQDSDKADEEASKLAELIINRAAIQTKANPKTSDPEAKALFFMSAKQAENLASLVLENPDATKKEVQAILKQGSGVDIALFGRMVADDPVLNTDASCQVAHSISTHKVENEYDYYTAVDDCSPEDSAGAGMIGTIEFNSATLYRYATIAVHELNEQLVDTPVATAKAVMEFARAFITSMPTGKQNTFANRTSPDAVMVTLRTNQPVNLVGAFECAVRENGEGFAKPSIESLAAYAEKVYDEFAGAPDHAWVIGDGLLDLGDKVNLSALLDALANEVQARFSPVDIEQ
jgi:CRISPR system Cascade subunit CasC